MSPSDSATWRTLPPPVVGEPTPPPLVECGRPLASLERSTALAPRLTHTIAWLRWTIPIVLGVLGFGYTIWESLLWDGYPLISAQVLLGLGLLGIAGPLLTFLTLTWAAQAGVSYERAEQNRLREHQQLLALYTISEAISESLDVDIILSRALERVLDVLHLTSGGVRLFDDGQLALRAARGVSCHFASAEPFLRSGECVCGRSVQQGELIAVEDLSQHAELAQTPCASEHLLSVLAAPLRTTDRIVGVIHVACRTPRTFDPDERALLTAVGQQVGAAVEKAQLHGQLLHLNQQLEERVTERTRALSEAKEELSRQADTLRRVLAEERRVEERTRAQIAHDLHDGVQQIIIGAIFQIQAARDAFANCSDTVLVRLTDAQDLLRRIESEMRLAIYNLRPVALDAQGLVPALRECMASFSRASQVQCEFRVIGTPRRFDAEAEAAVFRIVQQALHNVDAHARARRAEATVRFSAHTIVARVADDGVGFDASDILEQGRGHLGLMGMRERAESLGGKLEICSRVGEGTCVSLELPI